MERELEEGASGGACVRQELTEQQKMRTQRNKERAQALKEQRKHAKPYDRPSQERGKSPSTSHDSLLRLQPTALPDPAPFRNSCAGFMYEEEDDTAPQHRYRQVEEEGRYPLVCTYSREY